MSFQEKLSQKLNFLAEDEKVQQCKAAIATVWEDLDWATPSEWQAYCEDPALPRIETTVFVNDETLRIVLTRDAIERGYRLDLYLIDLNLLDGHRLIDSRLLKTWRVFKLQEDFIVEIVDNILRWNPINLT